MLLDSVKSILSCKICKSFATIPDSTPIAWGNKSAKILLLTQDPNQESQKEANKLVREGKKDFGFIFEDKNRFAVRISECLFGSGEYSPYKKNGINPNFNPDLFCWVHSSNVYCANNKTNLKDSKKHMCEVHLPSIKKEMSNGGKKILFLVIGGPALACVKGEPIINLRDEITDFIKFNKRNYFPCYHPSSSTRVWNKNNEDYQLAQKMVGIIRKEVNIFNL